MPVSIPTMINNMHTLRDQIEAEIVGQAALDLKGIFASAEKSLAFQESKFQTLLTKGDQLENIPANIDAANQIVQDTLGEIDKFLIGPGQDWADDIIPLMHKAGRDLARTNLDVRFLDPDSVKGAFDLVSIAEKGVLKTGYNDSYKIMNVVGDDVAEWFRQTMVDAVIEELPIVNKLDKNADTLMKRLVESGRIKPLVIKSKTGKIITRSITQRAEAIARIESGKIINRVHEVKASEVLGENAVYRNSNPHDSRTTPICRKASEHKPMTLKQWSESSLGRPPRLNPFHLCRSVLIGGRPAWFDDIPDETLTAQTPLPKTTPLPAGGIRAAQKAKAARAASKAKAAQEAAEAAAQALQQAKVSEAKATAFQKLEQAENSVQADAIFQDVLHLAQPLGVEAIKGLNDLDAAVVAKKKFLQAKGFKEELRHIIEEKEIAFKGHKTAQFADEMLEDLAGVTTTDDLNLYKNLVANAKLKHKLQLKQDFSDKFAQATTTQAKKELISEWAGKVDDFFAPAELINLEEAIALAESQEAATAYSAGLSQILSGKLGPKKIKTVQKQTKAAGLKAGIPDAEIDLAIAETLKALDAAFTEEQKLFALEYNALVKTKQVPVGDAAEILAKVKAGQLPGKAGAKAKQALESTQQKLSQAAPPVVTPEPSSIPATAPESAFEAVDAKFGALSGRDFTLVREARDLGGAHAKQIYTDPDGNQWLFKPNDAPFVVHGEEAVYKVQRLLDPKTPEVRYIEIDGTAGSIQRLVSDVSEIGGDVARLSPADLAALQREHVLDWLVSNHDGHHRQFLRDADGRLFGIDKGQAYKFLGDDRLDLTYHPNTVEMEPFYNILGRAARDGSLSLDPEETFRAIRTIEALDDEVYREWLRPYAAGRRGNAEAFLDLAVERKQNLRADFESWYREVLKDPSFRFGEVSAPAAAGVPADVVALVAEAEKAKWQGKALPFDGDMIEDQAALLYTDLSGEATRTFMKMKVRDVSDDSIMAWIRSQDIDAGSTPLGSPLPEDEFWSTIENAFKTVNTHASDKAYNQGALDAAYDLRWRLEALEAGADPDIVMMSKVYLRYLDELEEAVKEGKGTERREQYVKAFEDKTEAAVRDYTVRKGRVEMPLRTAQADGTIRVEKERAGNRDFHSQMDNQGEQYTIEWSDGTRIQYKPWSEGNYYAQRGALEVMLPAKPSAEVLEKMMLRLDEIGIDSRIPNPEDAELLYLLKQAYVSKEHTTTAYKKMTQKVQGRSTADQVTAHRQYWQNKLGVDDLNTLPHYSPQGFWQAGHAERGLGEDAFRAGYRHQLRFDISDADLNRDMKSYALHHNVTSTGGDAAGFLKEVLATNGSLVSSVEKTRVGVRVGGMSPSADFGTGGASYVFTRIKESKRGAGLYFKKSLLRRMDAISYNEDKFGTVEGDVVTNARAASIEEWKEYARASGNETIFKSSLNLLDDLDLVVVKTERERQEILDLFREQGITQLPDGRSPEDLIEVQ